MGWVIKFLSRPELVVLNFDRPSVPSDWLKTNLNLISFVISSVSGISIRFGKTIMPLRTEVIPALIAWYTPGAFATAIRPFILNFHWFTNWPIRNEIQSSIWKPSSITGGSRKQIETFPTIGTSVISGSFKAFSKCSLDQSDKSSSDGSQSESSRILKTCLRLFWVLL